MMTKRWFWLLLLATLVKPVLGVTIHEVLYDPTTESGGEAVLLYNQENVSRDISGYVIATEASSADATLPPGSFISAKGTFLVADSGWENAKNQSWPSANHEEALTMYNSDSGIALKDENGTVVDAAGWGDANGMPAEFYEGNPHAGAPEGMSLLRTQDTDDNSVDFIVAEPSFVVANGEEIPLILDVNASGLLSITNITLSTTRISPIAGVGATFDIVVDTSESATVIALAADQVVDLQEISNNKHHASIHLNYHLQPDNYTISVTASNGTDTISSETYFEYLPLAAVGLDVSTLDLKKLAPGRTTIIKGDTDPSTDSPTITNLGNVPVDIVLSARAPTLDDNTFSLSRIKYSFGDNKTSTLRTSARTKKVNLQPNSSVPLDLEIDVPASYDFGRYEGSITIGAI